MKSFLTVKELAKLLGVSENTIYLKCRSGEIKHTKTGSKISIFAQPYMYKNLEEENQNIIDYVFGDSTVRNDSAIKELRTALINISDNVNKILEVIEKI